MNHAFLETDIHWTSGGTGPLLVLVHGLPFQKALWNDVRPLLERTFTVVAPDLPGFGESGLPPRPPSMAGYADLLEALVLHLDRGPAILAGHSMGGYALLELAARRPGYLSGLAMVCSRATADSPDQAANRRAMSLRLRNEPPGFVAEAMLPRMVRRDGSDQGTLSRIRSAMEPLRAEGIAWCQDAIASRADFSARLHEIEVPALVLAGAKDQVVPLEESGIMAANFRQGRLAVIEGSGHCPMLDNPRETASALVAWARGANLV